MKKSYKVSPKEYNEAKHNLYRIEYHYGYNGKNGKSLVDGAGRTFEKRYPEIAKQYKESEEIVNNTPVPENDLFFKNVFMYNLWLNRKEDEPITSRELYAILNTLAEEMKSKISTATYGCVYSPDL